MKIALLLLAALLPQDPPAREKASAFTFARPKGWTRQELQNGMVALFPPGADAQQCSVVILAGGSAAQVNELVYHNQIWQNLTTLSQIPDPIEKAYRGSWQYSKAKVVTPQKQNQFMVLYTTKSDAHLEAVVFAAASEDLIQTYRFAVERMITGVEFPDARPKPSGAPEWKPAPVPEPATDVKIVGAWRVARMEQTLSVDPKAAGAPQRHTMKIVALFANGVAAKVDAARTGLVDSTYPAEGLATLSVSEPGANDRRFGRWTETDGKIRIKWNQGPEDVADRVGDHLKDAGGVTWSWIKPIDGVRLNRTYLRENAAGPPAMLRLRPDGTFDADLVNETMGGKLVNPKFPEMGSGVYEFRKWSLILRFDTGFVQSIHVMFDADDPAKAKKIFVSGTDFSLPGTASAPAGGVPIHGLVLPLPADWLRKNDPAGGVYLGPPANQNPNGYILFVSPATPLNGTHWESHKATLKVAMAWVQMKPEGATIVHDPFAPGPFIRTTVTGKIPTGEFREMQLYTAAHDGRLEAITTVNKIDVNVVWPILARTSFKDPPKDVERPKVVEAYRKLVRKQYTTPGGGPLAMGGIMYERLWLRADGTADFTSWYKEGYAASNDVFKLDAGLLTGHAGSWKEVDGKIRVRRSADGGEEVYERVNGDLGAYESMPRVDGLKLSGRYSKRSQPGAGVVQFYHWIDFTEDGKFKTDGVLTWVGSLDQDWPKFSDKLSGTYEIRDWTIFFELDDGRAWSTDFSTIHKDPKDLSGILLRTNVFLKE